MKLDIKQRTKAWHDIRKTHIGSSEIFGLIKYYLSPEELINIGIDLDTFKEQPYVSAFELYHKIKSPALYVGGQILRENEIFGQRMEELAFDILREDKTATYTKGKVYTKDGRIASLDIEGISHKEEIFFDINSMPIDPVENPEFIVEIKAVYDRHDNDKPLDWRHIFQIQYAMDVAEKKWGEIIMISLHNDTAFERGYVCGMAKKPAVAYLRKNADFRRYVMKRREDYILIINMAMDRFMADIASNNEPLPTSVKSLEMLYNIIHQKSSLLRTEGKLLEMHTEVDAYIENRLRLKKLEATQDHLKQSVLERMLLTGKMKAVGMEGIISMSRRGLVAREAK